MRIPNILWSVWIGTIALALAAAPAVATVIPIDSSLDLNSAITPSSGPPNITDGDAPNQGATLLTLSASTGVADGSFSVFSSATASWTNAALGTVDWGLIGYTETGSGTAQGFAAGGTFLYHFQTGGPGTITIDFDVSSPDHPDPFPDISFNVTSFGVGFDGGNLGSAGSTIVFFPNSWDEMGTFVASFGAGVHELKITTSSNGTGHAAFDTDTKLGTFDFTIVAVPEPSVALLLTLGLLGLVCLGRRRPYGPTRPRSPVDLP